MASVCYRCKLGYGHYLMWCPGCGQHMVQVKSVDWRLTAAAGWKHEGNPELLEYFLNGHKLVAWKRNDALLGAVMEEHPGLLEALGLVGEGIADLTADKVKIVRSEYTRSFELTVTTDKLSLRITRPVIRFRLVGSDLEVDPVPRKEQEFDLTKLE